MLRADQQLDIYPFSPGRLAQQLRLIDPILTGGNQPFQQLRYVGRYLQTLTCRSVLIERHYIDRDFIEDHSVFYSRSLVPYPNYCQRAHFFTLTPAQLETEFARLTPRHASTKDRMRKTWDRFSQRSYLGFAIIKPLPGSPVGRTVLRPFRRDAGKGFVRRFDCVGRTRTHVAGIELSVSGLAFQQQDVGVSACATTALWSSLQRVRELEDIAPATPAQITTLASRYTLPFGRAMPSEGLSLDQMCQAVQALGAAPNLFRADQFQTARGYIHSAIRSRLPPILILEHGQRQDRYHAVAAVGMRVRKTHAPDLVAEGFDDTAGDMKALYVHDDRYGPYMRANIVRSEGGLLRLDLLYQRQPAERSEPWFVTHVLVPTHPKVRLSFAAMRDAAVALVADAKAVQNVIVGERNAPIQFSNWIARIQEYFDSLYFGRDRGPAVARRIAVTSVLPRYVGIVRLRSRWFGPIDVLLDTTSTTANLNCLGVAVLPEADGRSLMIGRFLAARLQSQIL